MAIQNVMLPDDVFGIGPSGEETGDDTTDMSTKDASLKYDESNRPQPSESKFTLEQENNGETKAPTQEIQNESAPVQSEVPTPPQSPTEGGVTPTVMADIPQPSAVQRTQTSAPINQNVNDNGDDGDENATLKPSFTNPEDVKPNIEIL